ncbi:hypothetical protein BCR34DRAFT_20262 [Clohesyomyces aquaticus]|uniref:Uncharacterized protein n=1 Tax=Clohesyomyces aquaticus TaxID=1231657 RepID=A0A1Y1ZAT7_9PLEO|nr:hypothetical protein BCR34DRAFT_20262 [Clohesyomyces aquaticus]
MLSLAPSCSTHVTSGCEASTSYPPRVIGAIRWQPMFKNDRGGLAGSIGETCGRRSGSASTKKETIRAEVDTMRDGRKQQTAFQKGAPTAAVTDFCWVGMCNGEPPTVPTNVVVLLWLKTLESTVEHELKRVLCTFERGAFSGIRAHYWLEFQQLRRFALASKYFGTLNA